jgi:hypothetical protein
MRTEAEDAQDIKDARRNKRIQELQRSKRLHRGNIWFSNSVMPIELQPAAQVYRVMSKAYPKGFWPLSYILEKTPPKLYCDSPSCKRAKKHATIGSYEYFCLYCYSCAQTFLVDRLGIQPWWGSHNEE